MPKRLKIIGYVVLVFINGLISTMAGISFGSFLQYEHEVENALIRLNKLNQNKSKIFNYIHSNCSNLILEYPEFALFPQIDLCGQYGLSLEIAKIVVFLSSIYNTILPFMLYGPPILPVIIVSFTSLIMFLCSYTNDYSMVLQSEFITVVAGYLIILTEVVAPNFDDFLKRKYQELRHIFIKDNHIYDNVNSTDEHGA